MKTFKQFLIDDFREDHWKPKNQDKKILDMWASNADIEDIIKVTRKKVGYIKNLLKQNNRKGWEEL